MKVWSKIMEKTVVSRLNDHLAKYALNETYQSACRSLHSTETALLKVKNDLLSALDQQKAALVVLLDLSANFNTIDFSI